MNLQDNIAVRHTSADHAIIAVGRHAINESLNALYQGRQPRLFENPHPMRLGGPDPLEGIGVFQRNEPLPHWHYVTYGFSELFDKETKNAAVSGFGFELTFRLAADPGATEPPLWPIHLLQSLGRYVFRSRNAFQDGHRMSANGPISLGSPTQLCSMGFALDRELAAIDTPNGRVAFLQVIGLTLDEEHAAQKWDTKKLLDMLLPYTPLWITHLKRRSFLTEPSVLAQATEGIRKDGSSSGVVFTDVLEVGEQKRLLRQSLASITLGARVVEQLAELLPLRLGYGKPFALCGPSWRLHFELAKKNAWRLERGVVRIFVNPATVQEFATLLHPRQGVYKLPSFQNILWDVKQTTIRNAEGEIVDIIG
jgi:suppressor of fused-like protein